MPWVTSWQGRHSRIDYTLSLGVFPTGTSFVTRDFTTSTGIERMGYERVINSFEFSTRNESSMKLLDFTKSHRFHIAGSWYECLELHCCTWCSNTSHVTKEISHKPVDRWKVHRIAGFFRVLALWVLVINLWWLSWDYDQNLRLKATNPRLKDKNVSKTYSQ